MLLAEGRRAGAVKDVKGSVISPEGEVRGVGRFDGMEVAFLKRRVPLRPPFADVGDARRDRVWRKLDLRFGGGVGRVCISRGKTGSSTPGCDSRNFLSKSTISNAVRVRVRLWVGAVKGVTAYVRNHSDQK